MPLTTNSVHLVIKEVGPWKGSAFGGIVAIKIFGCYADPHHQPQPDTSSLSEEKQPREIDWYDDGSYETGYQTAGTTDTETQDTDEEEDEFFSYESNDYQESLDQQNQEDSVEKESYTDEDWYLFGSFGSDNEVEKGNRQRDRAAKEKVQSNLKNLDESIAEKSEGNPSNKQTILYIIREVLI